MTALEPIPLPTLPADLEDLAHAALGYARANRATSTQRAYATDWSHFSAWTASHALDALPAEPETVALYVTDLAATYRPSTINRRLATIAIHHKRAGLDPPTSAPGVREVMKGIRRSLTVAQREAAPAVIGEVRRMVAHLPDDIAGTRDRALLLVGFAGAMRRSELVGLDVADLSHRDQGLAITIRSSKTDQEGAGRQVAIPWGTDPETCPVRALQAWIEAAGIEDGPLFRPIDRHGNVSPTRLSDRAVALVVKRAAEGAGLDPTNYSGHSLRAGFATTAAANGASERAIANQTGHKSMEVLRRYVRHGSLFTDNAATMLGL
jgi:site-specific recombinase XerD